MLQIKEDSSLRKQIKRMICVTRPDNKGDPKRLSPTSIWYSQAQDWGGTQGCRGTCRCDHKKVHTWEVRKTGNFNKVLQVYLQRWHQVAPNF